MVQSAHFRVYQFPIVGRGLASMASMLFTTAKPASRRYHPILPYTEDDNETAANFLCPRYAEADPTSAPPSPASLESFDILDNIPWRQSYISLSAPSFRDAQLKRPRARLLVAVLLVLFLLALGCSIAGFIAVKRTKGL
ncbi:hypothetical protein ACN47E_009088 [Coniothyrium glycines]